MTMKTIFSLGLLLALTSSARAEVVKDWMDSSNYPAQVLAIPIGNSVLSRDHPIRLGAWTIRFSNEAVVATYQTMNMGMQHDCQSITTYNTNNRGNSGLVCSNAVLGTAPCNFSANSTNGKCIDETGQRQAISCAIGVFNEQGTIIRVACPDSLNLAR
jgi:hypothetical protein